MEKRDWISWFTWRTNKTPRQGICTTYVGHRHFPSLPKEWGHKVPPPPRSDLRSPEKISRLGEPPRSRWEFSQKRREREKTTRGKPVFPGTGPVSLFSRSAFILWVIHRDKWKIESHEGQQSWPLLKPCFLSAFLPIYKVLRWFTSSSGQEAC